MRVGFRSFVVSVAILVAAVSFGQAPAGANVTIQKGHANRGAELEKEMMQKLNLTSSQKDQIKAAYKTMTTSLKELKKSEKGTVVNPEDKKEKTKAIRKTYTDTLKTILTPSQMIQLKALRKELREKAKEAKEAASAPAAKTP